MRTKLFSNAFAFKPVSMEFVAAVLAASGITDAVITGVDQDDSGIYFTANRHLTEAEKPTVKQVFLSSLIDITDQ